MPGRFRDVAVGCAFLGGAALLWFETTREHYAATGARAGFNTIFFPRLVLATIACLALVLIVRGILSGPRGALPPAGAPASAWRLLGIVLAMVLYVAAIPALGFTIAGWLFVPVMLGMLGFFARPLACVAVSLAFPPAVWVFVRDLLNIQLPISPWFNIL